MPPPAEQQEIVRRVEWLFKFADQIEARYNKAKAYVDKGAGNPRQSLSRRTGAARPERQTRLGAAGTHTRRTRRVGTREQKGPPAPEKETSQPF